MSATPDLPTLLRASLEPSTRREAEQRLKEIAASPGFLPTLLQFIVGSSAGAGGASAVDRSIRLAGAVYLKNVVKNNWVEDEGGVRVPDADKATLRAQLVPAIIALANASDKAVRAQVAESVSVIATSDFPDQWPQLIDQLVQSLSPSPSSYATNLSILETAHSIFGHWRAETRSDALFRTINFVLERFAQPFVEMFRYTANILLSIPSSSSSSTASATSNATPKGEDLKAMAQSQVMLLHLFYDLTYQDLPPLFEDSSAEFFDPEKGWFVRFLAWEPEELKGDPDEPTPSLPSQVKSTIFEITEMYIYKYSEVLAGTKTVETFVHALWSMLGGGQRSGLGFDNLVSQSLRFLSSAIRSGNYKQIFEARETIQSLVEGVVVPNIHLREHEIEQFEDDPLEYVRFDLSFASSAASVSAGGLSAEGTTRRQAAADVLRALVSSGLEAQTTEVVSTWINQGLRAYQEGTRGATKDDNAWRNKDTAVYLMTAVATRGATASQGVTSTNPLVDVVGFFSENVYADLRAQVGEVHPILQVDAIRYLYSFRNQLTKEQLMSVLPDLLRHLASSNYVCYTYAAITIERVLFIRRTTHLLFTQEDIQGHANEIISTILTKIETSGTPEKIAENDFLIKCIMRVILTARQSLLPTYERQFQRLLAILAAISKNPSNPNFDQYLFESISALIRFVVPANSESLAYFEQSLFGPFTTILQQDIDQFVPYAFQILSQMLELHQADIPPDYRSLLPFLLQPASWQQKGTIPGLVRLLKAFLKRDGAGMAANGQFTSVLAVVQQRLIPSKVNDAYGFELLQAVLSSIPPAALQPHMKNVVTMLLTRLQTSRTDDFAYYTVYFFAFCMAIKVDGLTPDFLIGSVESLQPNLWSQLLGGVVLKELPRMLPKDRKVVIVGMTRMLTESSVMLTQPAVQQWPACFTEVVKLFSESKHLTSAQSTDVQDPDEALRALDFEEQGTGYQASYSKLAASETVQGDPVAHVPNVRDFVGQELVRVSKSDPQLRNRIQAADPAVVVPFMQTLASSGFVL